MTEDEVRRLRETLFVIQEQLVRNLMYDALANDEPARLNLFRVYRGGMMDGVVVDWWKVFGNTGTDTHWTNLLPEETHEKVRQEIDDAFAELDPAEDRQAVWKRIQVYRNTSVAHLDFDEDGRAKQYPRLSPLRVSAEIVYRHIFELLANVSQVDGFVLPIGMAGENREDDLGHHREMFHVARQALMEFENTP